MRSLASVALAFLIFPQAVFTQGQLPGTAVPNVIAYSGRLHLASTAGSVANPFGVTFSIYRQQDGGAPIWLETQNVSVDNGGRFRVLLGRTRAEGIPASLFSAQEERTNSVGRQIKKEGKTVTSASEPAINFSKFTKVPPLRALIVTGCPLVVIVCWEWQVGDTPAAQVSCANI